MRNRSFWLFFSIPFSNYYHRHTLGNIDCWNRNCLLVCWRSHLLLDECTKCLYTLCTTLNMQITLNTSEPNERYRWSIRMSKREATWSIREFIGLFFGRRSDGRVVSQMNGRTYIGCPIPVSSPETTIHARCPVCVFVCHQKLFDFCFGISLRMTVRIDVTTTIAFIQLLYVLNFTMKQWKIPELRESSGFLFKLFCVTTQA